MECFFILKSKKEERKMKKMFVTCLIGFVSVLTLSFSGAVDAQQKPYVFKVQSGWPAADYANQNCFKFAEIVEASSGGRIKMEISTAGALVPNSEILRR
jgi:TRAP-type C4-dicarboxylate transport system substrate-binding protein